MFTIGRVSFQVWLVSVAGLSRGGIMELNQNRTEIFFKTERLQCGTRQEV